MASWVTKTKQQNLTYKGEDISMDFERSYYLNLYSVLEETLICSYHGGDAAF